MDNILNNVQELLGIAKKNDIFNMTTKEFAEFEHFVYSAIELQIPGKVEVISNLESYCPHCDSEVENDYYSFSWCEKCGQKLDWL